MGPCWGGFRKCPPEGLHSFGDARLGRSNPRRFANAGLSFFFLLASALLSAGCGSVGEPLPPLLNIPERSQDLAARQKMNDVVLEWTWPRATTEGMPLRDLARFEVYGMEITDPSQPPSAEVLERMGRPLASLQDQALEPYSPGEKVQLALPSEPMRAKTMAIAVRAESSRGRSGEFSNIAVIQVIEPPAQPGRPRAGVEPEAIVIDWAAAEGAACYRVFRRSNDNQVSEEIGRSCTTQFRDADFQWNQSYFYQVRSVGESATGEVEGSLSRAVQVFAKDTFPPAEPLNLSGVLTPSSVELSWGENRETDLAGYRVRRAEDSGPGEPLHEGLLTGRTYSDKTIEAGRSYLYTVTAADESFNESEPSEPVRISVPREWESRNR